MAATKGATKGTTKAKGEFELTGWDEDTYEELDGGAKLTRATVTQRFTGDLEGDGAVQWLMAYADDGTARFVGLQRVRGMLDDRKGAFVLEVEGTFDGALAKGTWTVVPGSGTGDLTGLEGTGGFEAPRGPKATWTLAHRLA
jgi:hypothetical protein